MEELLEMLTYKRPHGSATEFEFTNKYLTPVGGQLFAIMDSKLPAAYIVQVPDNDYALTSKTLFSCHVDTVHHIDGTQVVIFDRDKLVAYKTDNEPLGADDAAGVWVMLKMIKAGVPGTYLFHRGEEKGGIGSKFISDNHEDFLAQFDRAIAFDRKGTSSVITHQGCGRCCSDVFANAIADGLNDLMPDDAWCPDDTGIYTDTAEYIRIVPECTNISVGYYAEHSAAESLDVAFVMRLADACIALNWENLPVVRKVTDVDDSWGTFDFGLSRSQFAGLQDSTPYVSIDGFLRMSDQEIDDMCWDSPETATELLTTLKEHLIFNN